MSRNFTIPSARSRPACQLHRQRRARYEERKDVVSATLPSTGVAIVTTTATQAIHVPVLSILGEDDVPTCGPNIQGGNFDCSTGAVVALQEVLFYSPQARIHACVIPFSGHDVSLAINHRL